MRKLLSTESQVGRTVRRLVANRAALISFLFLAFLLFVAAFADPIAPRPPLQQDLSRALEGPSPSYWLGTDNLGRDVLSRLVFGTRVSLTASSIAVATAIIIGVPLGFVSGYAGGWLDNLLMRVTDGFMSLPNLLLVIAIIAVLGSSLTNSMVALGIVFAPNLARLVRGEVLAEREELYVDAARTLGLSPVLISVRHVLPNVVSPLVIQVSLMMGWALILEAGLSFIGLGVQPPLASWGSMLANASTFLDRQPLLVWPPGIAITLTVLAFNLLGDGLRDSLGRGLELARQQSPELVQLAGGPNSAESEEEGDPVARLGDGNKPEIVSESVDAVDAVEGDGLAHGRPDSVVLSVRGLEVSFQGPDHDRQVVVDGVDLDLGQGEIVGLVGESGSGKSLTALSLMRLTPPAAHVRAASMTLGETDLMTLSEAGLRDVRGNDISMIFQEPMTSLNPVFTVGDQLREAIRAHQQVSRKIANREAIGLLGEVGIPEPAQRMADYPYQFSGGMAQRVMIAMALCCKPRVLLADEPTTALDVTVQSEILQLLRRLQEDSGLAVLFVTHDLGVVSELCDRVMVMYAGKVVETAATDALIVRPKHPYTSGLIHSIPQLIGDEDESLYRIEGQMPSPGDMPIGCRFAPRCPYELPSCTLPDSDRWLRIGSDHRTRCLRAQEIELKGAE